MLAKSILALAGTVMASASQPGNHPSPEQQRFFLTCSGTMRAAGAPLMPITASGLVDLAGRRVTGFGLGSVPILLVTNALIGFGGAAGANGERVEGSFDRQNGKIKIVVRAAKDPPHELIAMEFDCRPAPSIS
jgi:hypothetical protein